MSAIGERITAHVLHTRLSRTVLAQSLTVSAVDLPRLGSPQMAGGRPDASLAAGHA